MYPSRAFLQHAIEDAAAILNSNEALILIAGAPVLMAATEIMIAAIVTLVIARYLVRRRPGVNNSPAPKLARQTFFKMVVVVMPSSTVR